MPMIISIKIIYDFAIETTLIFMRKQKELSKVKWTDGEANLDSQYSKLACLCCEEAWKKMQANNLNFAKITIKCSSPDINIRFYSQNKTSTSHQIELKSSITTRMVGCGRGQLNINKPLIWCLRPSHRHKTLKKYTLRCSQYHHAFRKTEISLFVQRTPRPYIYFHEMSDINHPLPFSIENNSSWINEYVKSALHRIEETTVCKKTFQDDIVRLLKNQILEDYVTNTSETQFKEDKISFQNKNT